MDIFSVIGVFALIPTILLITVSFFVMFTLTKVDKSVLRIFGMVVVALLWIIALIIFSAGIFLVAQAPDYFGGPGLARSGNCKFSCPLMTNSNCGMNRRYHGMMDYSYHKGMMNPHAGMGMSNIENMMQDKAMNCPGKQTTEKDYVGSKINK
jgi:hypothetical protein